MHIIHLDDKSIAAGKAAFSLYRAAVMCGPSADIYDPGMWRDTGIAIIPGAILACIAQGMTTKDEIVSAVARVSRCKRTTVETVLGALTGADPERNLWGLRDQRYYDLRNIEEGGSRVHLLLAA